MTNADTQALLKATVFVQQSQESYGPLRSGFVCQTLLFRCHQMHFLVNSLDRNRSAELMDQPGLPLKQHQHALKGLATINRWTGVARKMYGVIRRIAREHASAPLRILDIASGSGDLPIHWARRAAVDGLSLDITTADISPVSIDTQLSHARRAGVSLHCLQVDCLEDHIPGDYDLVTNSLFMHHLDEPDVVKLIGRMNEVARRSVLICDLERSRVNLALVSMGAHIMTRSPVVHTDAKLSVHGSYTVPEFRTLCRQAIDTEPSINRVFPCRFMATWKVE